VTTFTPDFRFERTLANLLILPTPLFMRVPRKESRTEDIHPVGEKQNRSFQPCFNGFLKVDFQGSRVTSDGGLILVRELDEQNRELVADQLAAAAGEDGRAVGETCTVLLAPVGLGPFDAAGVRGDFAEDLGAAAVDWIGRGGGEGNRLKEGGWDGKVSETSLGTKVLGLFFHTGRRPICPLPVPSESLGTGRIQEAGTSGRGWEYTADTESQNGNSGSRRINHSGQDIAFDLKPSISLCPKACA
jgi:hypothetical protein